MKKLFVIIVGLLIMFSCQKRDETGNPAESEVIFQVKRIDPGNGLKTSEEWECPTDDDGNLLEPAYAEIDIDGTTYTPAVYRLNGRLYTQAIKLPTPGNTTTYTVNNFLLYTADDQLVMATPETGSDYSEYVSQGVEFTFQVSPFAKSEVPVEVLCFLPGNYIAFGFTWYQVKQIVLREFCFFGDICLKHPDDYLSSLYGTAQPPVGECQVDMSALFKIYAYVGDTTLPENRLPNSPFTNATAEANYGVGSPLCVQYPDNLEIEGEEFTFNLYILVKSGDDFEYKYFATFTSTDDGPLMDKDGEPVPDVGGDGVTEFVLGSCNFSDTDIQFPPYLDLPESCTLVIDNPWAPGTVSGDYCDAIISGINGSGYDINNGIWGCYCFDRSTYIYVNTPYQMDIYSTLNGPALPAFLQVKEWDRLNWLINHLDNYDWNWSDLQQALWKIEDPGWSGSAFDGCAAITSVGIDMYTDANAYGDGYVPLPGGWAAVCFVPAGTPPDQDRSLVQTVFIMVDP